MHTTNTNRIEFINIPGISGKVKVEKIAKSSMYVFMLRSGNNEEFKTLERLTPIIKADITTSSVAFLYSMREQYPTQEKFDEVAMKKACCGMEHFENILIHSETASYQRIQFLQNPLNTALHFLTWMMKT